MASIDTRKADAEWVRQSFLLDEGRIEDEDMVRRTLSSASFKFTDTTIGGNFAINPPPQFTRHGDIKLGGTNDSLVMRRSDGQLFQRNKDDVSKKQKPGSPSKGMGRYYSEAIDDNGQYVIMRFGVPEYNSLTQFFGNFYDVEAGRLARTGRGPSLFQTAGKITGLTLALPFLPFVVGGRIIRAMAQIPASKYYYLKPAMPLYWAAVDKMLNAIGINMGLVPAEYAPELEKAYNNPQKVTPQMAEQYSAMMPDVIDHNGRINMYSVASRAQRMANVYNVSLRDALDKSTGVEAFMRTIEEFLVNPIADPRNGRNLNDYIKQYMEIETNKPDDDPDKLEVATRDKYDNPTFMDFFEAERRDGASFVTFRVDFTNTADESFGNQPKDTDVAGKINSISGSHRNTTINFEGGNIGDGVMATAVETALGMARDVVTGVASGLSMGGLVALAGGGLVDIPKVWDQSSAQLTRLDCSIELRSPYGNKLSRLRNLYMPLAMLLAGTLPLSAGRHAYTSPFLLEAYCRGRAAIRLGMIESLSISRGAGNIGWTQEGEPLGIDVKFSIVDLSNVMHMPIASQFKPWEGAVLSAGEKLGTAGTLAASAITASTWDDDTSYGDYLSVLGSLSYQDMVYPTRRWRLNVANQLGAFEHWRSPARLANWIMGTVPGRFLNAISDNTDRPG